MAEEITDTDNNNNNSLCEKSMKVVVNIFKLSSFSIAKMSLGETTTKSIPSDSDTVADDGPTPQPPRSSGVSEKLQSRSKPYLFVMQPDSGENESLRVEEKRDEGDGKFAAYIRKVHEKNRGNLHEAAKLSPYILPPPPTPLRRKK